MPNKLDLSKLSLEERQELSRLIAENEALKAESFTKDQIIKTKDNKIKTLNETISELTKVLIKEKEIVKKYNLERYFSKADRPIRTATKEAKRSNGLPSTIVREMKNPGRKAGSKNFGDNFLEELSSENEPITLDIAQQLTSQVFLYTKSPKKPLFSSNV